MSNLPPPGHGAWTPDQRRRIGDAEELQLASYRTDGSLRPYVTMWVVRAGADLFVRSAGGPNRTWYRLAVASGRGRIRAGGVEQDVVFANADDADHGDIDAGYHGKYDRYGPTIVGHVVGSGAVQATIRLLPQTETS
jgi:hypothetical protein